MSSAFEDVRTLPASKTAKKIMKDLVSKDIFEEQRDVWTLGASLGIANGKTYKKGTRETFQNVNSLDPESIFSAILFGLLPDNTPKERAKKLVDYAEWGIREINRREQNGTLDFGRMSERHVLSKETTIDPEKELKSKKENRVYFIELINEGENDKIEFKSSLCWDYKEEKKNRVIELEVAITVSAFMNSEGGYLFIGIGDDKQILGLDKDISLFKTPNYDVFAQHFTNIINNHLGKENRPYVTIRFNEIECKKIAVVIVPKRAPNPVYTKYGEKEQFYIRLGNSSHPLNVREATTYIRNNFFKRV